MIIPMRCFTCGMLISSKWRSYERSVAEAEDEMGDRDPEDPETAADMAKRRSEIMERLYVTRYCCRRHFLGHVDLMEII